MKVAVLVDSFPRSSQPFVTNQVEGLLQRGVDVEVFANEPPAPNDEASVENTVTARTTYTPIPQGKLRRAVRGAWLGLRSIHRAPRLVARVMNPVRFGRDAFTLRPLYHAAPLLDEEFDILHCHFGPKGRIGAILKQAGVPGRLVISIHGYGARQAERHPEQYADLFEAADLFLVNSIYTYDRLVNAGAPEQRVAHHPLGIDVESVPFKWDTETAERTDTVRIITVARLVELKGIDYSIRAIGRLVDRVDADIEYHIVGDGEERADLEELAGGLGLSDTVTFHGHTNRNEVIRMLADADLFTLPSLEEAFGMVLLEAQAVGLPIVATRVGGIPEVVREGETAILVPPGDEEALADEIEGLLHRRSEWRAIGRVGRESVATNYDSEQLIEDLIDRYQTLLRDGTGP
jgi:colanic acid/amylovoran biosynthesis glycosyltransferase